MTPPFDLEHLTRETGAAWWPLLWRWMHEQPTMNLDDTAPTSLKAFAALMSSRLGRDLLWGVHLAGQPVGVIGYDAVSPSVGKFHGICFTRTAHGTGVPFQAVRAVLQDRFLAGVETVQAQFFADNTRVTRFFEKLGAVHEGLLDVTTLQGGVPIAIRSMAWYSRQGRIA